MTRAREPAAAYRIRRPAASPVRRVNARFDPDTARKLKDLMRLRNLTVTQALKQAVETLHEKLADSHRPTSYEVALKVGLIGCAEGPEDLSTNYKRYLREALERKHGIVRENAQHTGKWSSRTRASGSR